MAVVVAHKCHKGLKRPQNEDYIWVDEQIGLFIVADGLGGHDAGDVASQQAATTAGTHIATSLKGEPFSASEIRALITEAVETANTEVYETAKTASQKRKMGTTIVLALIQTDTAFISHVGDSRAYLARAATLTQLTEDDSWRVEFGDQTQTQGSGRRNRFEHFLTKAIGQPSTIDPSFQELEILPGDWLLLCSDGLWNIVDDDQILAALQQANADPSQATKTLVEAANAAGGDDNISVVAIYVQSTTA